LRHYDISRVEHERDRPDRRLDALLKAREIQAESRGSWQEVRTPRTPPSGNKLPHVDSTGGGLRSIGVFCVMNTARLGVE
jgi:hypothetical protein